MTTDRPATPDEVRAYRALAEACRTYLPKSTLGMSLALRSVDAAERAACDIAESSAHETAEAKLAAVMVYAEWLERRAVPYDAIEDELANYVAPPVTP